ncbi:hypothetical protein B0O99DRAFT_625847 [Bisporella sp. PMI_857]|nr:hypothetical protein B0O99DRAFT_625847 [Bisporella sp. PMI_857]
MKEATLLLLTEQTTALLFFFLRAQRERVQNVDRKDRNVGYGWACTLVLVRARNRLGVFWIFRPMEVVVVLLCLARNVL